MLRIYDSFRLWRMLVICVDGFKDRPSGDRSLSFPTCHSPPRALAYSETNGLSSRQTVRYLWGLCAASHGSPFPGTAFLSSNDHRVIPLTHETVQFSSEKFRNRTKISILIWAGFMWRNKTHPNQLAQTGLVGEGLPGTGRPTQRKKGRMRESTAKTSTHRPGCLPAVWSLL